MMVSSTPASLPGESSSSLCLALEVVGLNARPNVGEAEERRWSEMVPELLESISDRLSLQDYLAFCFVCKHWQFAPSYRSEIVHIPRNRMWFMFYGFDKNELDKCYLYTFAHPKVCEVRVPLLRGATCMKSKLGWLLAKRNNLFFFCNPFSGEKIDLPEYPLQMEAAAEQVCTFSSVPTSHNCTAFIISRRNDMRIDVSSCSVGGREWVTKKLRVSAALLGTMTLASYRDGSCPRDGKDVNCLYIWGSSTKAVIYFVARKKYVLRQPKFALPRLQVPESLVSLHHADWLDKFGGSVISICPSQVSNAHVGISWYDYEATLEGRIATRVKAVCILPLSDRVKTEASQKPIKKRNEESDASREAKRRCLVVNFKQ